MVFFPHVEKDHDPLQLTLGIPSPSSLPSPCPNPLESTPPPIPPVTADFESLFTLPSSSSFPPSNHGGGILPSSKSRHNKIRRSSNRTFPSGKNETVESIYPWATNRRATVHSMNHLLSNGITTITGKVQCKRCNKQFEISYDLQEKFSEIATYISKKKFTMHDRAPSAWINPQLLDCKFCEQINCVKPVQSKKRSTNWLFLLLGQFLGCCKLSELKYFCKHTRNHRTGAKDRVLYLTYLELCNQVDPRGPFDL